jgi:N-hydroxyarylamine O-acetyltransferase
MNLQVYLNRIGYSGTVEPTLSCLTAIHRLQAFTIPYENLDIQLGRRVDRDREQIFDKLVLRQRGGWCYETHELLHWALSAIGFDAKLVTAGIHRNEFGDVKLGNHTAILVALDRIYLADLGLGDGIRDPIPLSEGTYVQGKLTFRLERIEDGYWRFFNHAFAYPTNFDFRDEPLDAALIDQNAEMLQTSNESLFVQNLVCQIMQPESVTCLTGRVLRQKTPEGTSKKLVKSSEFERVLADVFGIRCAEAASVWPRIEERHRQLFGEKPIEELDVSGF